MSKELLKALSANTKTERVVTVIQILHGGLVRVAAEGFVMDVKGDFSVGDELLLSGDVPVKKLSQTNVVHYR